MENKKISLKVCETNSRFVGRSVALIDPKIIEENNLNPGDVLELSNTKTKNKSYCLLWSGYPEDYGRETIRIDGYTRNSIAVGIDDLIDVKKIKAGKAIQITLSPTEDLSISGFEDYFRQLFDGRVVSNGDRISLNIMGRKIDFVITNMEPKEEVLIADSASTRFKIGSKYDYSLQVQKKNLGVTYEEIGGLKNEVQKVREMIELPLRHPEIFDKIGVEAPKGVLLHGPPGTGKTLLAKAVANETNANFYTIGGPEIMSKFYGESEEKLREVFKQAQENSPSIIFIDEIDSIAPKREDVSGDVEKRVVSQLLTLMDGLKSRGKVIVIAATNRPNSVDPALRRPGRFDREIEIGIPDASGRHDILQIHTKDMPLSKDVDLKNIAKTTHGFVGADLELVSKEAAMRSLRKILPKINLNDEKIPVETLNTIEIKNQDFIDALKDISPSALREVLVQRPDVDWNAIGGLKETKEELIDVTQLPLKHSELFKQVDVKPPKGVLLYGPPGTGKTLIAKAVASTSESNFISIKGPELLSKWVGESEKGVREIFRKARQASPCVIFFDEIDALAPIRQGSGGMEGGSSVTERVVSQLLTEMDGLEDLRDVVVIGATNRPDIIDKALLRPGRFDKILNIPVPDKEGRKQIFDIHFKNKPLSSDIDVKKLVDETDTYTGADIEYIVNEAAILAIKEYINNNNFKEEQKDSKKKDLKISMNHFETVLKNRKKKESNKIKEQQQIQ
ncbi:MAG: CDC48 family AAA ATPase [Nitrososphaeraceae archaeon]